ncbi:MAG: MBL fold metallo-hydrolase [Anaerolineae bacterium]|jgi:glyoxylase-like metal-dependent hydrolase (beta-lactamase superfamily II)
MIRERVTEDVFIFISKLYAEVVATVIVTPEGAVVIDTLPFPQEAKKIREFALRRSPAGIRYVVNTHHHADHIYGSYLFPEAELIAHRECRQILLKVGEESLARARVRTPELAPVKLRIPQLVFETEILLRPGEKTIHLIHAPGHTPDGLMVHIVEDKVLVAGDAMAPVPLAARGDFDALIKSMKKIKNLKLENVIQGHGGVLLRGEIDETVDTNVAYLRTIKKKVQAIVSKGLPKSELQKIDIEDCGLSRIPLGGLVQRLHLANLEYLYNGIVTKQESSK